MKTNKYIDEPFWSEELAWAAQSTDLTSIEPLWEELEQKLLTGLSLPASEVDFKDVFIIKTSHEHTSKHYGNPSQKN